MILRTIAIKEKNGAAVGQFIEFDPPQAAFGNRSLPADRREAENFANVVGRTLSTEESAYALVDFRNKQSVDDDFINLFLQELIKRGDPTVPEASVINRLVCI